MEIKFRGKRIDNGEWVYGYHLKTPLTQENCCDASIGDGWHFLSGRTRYCIATEEGAVYEVIPETVGQFTGLHDRVGKDIYDGDIVKHLSDPSGYIFPEPYIYQIVWSGSGFTIQGELKIPSTFILDDGWSSLLEVVGNRFDNPQLLTQ